MCHKCQNTGMYADKCHYPWGGYDWVYVFCTCSIGVVAEHEYAIFHGLTAN